MNIKDITELLNAVSKTDNNSTPPSDNDPVDKGRCIVIGNRGNVVVGDLVMHGLTGSMINASVIRRWGTERGLGQLAIEGKTSKTVLDYCNEFEFNMLTTCGVIPVGPNSNL